MMHPWSLYFRLVKLMLLSDTRSFIQLHLHIAARPDKYTCVCWYLMTIFEAQCIAFLRSIYLIVQSPKKVTGITYAWLGCIHWCFSALINFNDLPYILKRSCLVTSAIHLQKEIKSDLIFQAH